MGEANFEIYKDVSGKFRFRLKAPNNKIVAVSEGYETKTGCMKGVEAVKEYSGATIRDLTSGETTLVLDEPAKRYARKDSVFTFSGKLARDDTGEGVAGARVDIYERDRSSMKDDHLASGKTQSDGTFNIGWTAKEMDWWDNTVEVYAKYEGTASLKPSRSNHYVLIIVA